MNYKLIARYVGLALSFESGFMFLSLMVSVFNGMDSSFSPLLISSLVTLFVGQFPLIFVKKSEEISISDGFVITVLSWVLSCVFGMFPYLLWGEAFTISNAWFESVSGFTTTGATILSNIEALPKGLLFYRSSTHFLGGLGVVAFMLLVLPSMSTFRMKMFKMEISNLSKDNYHYRTKQSLRIILTVYLSIAVCTFTALWLAGMSPFDAVNHAMSITATGGFSTKNQSLATFGSFNIEWVAMIFMLISGVHFGLTYSFFSTGSCKIFKNPVFRFYISVLVISMVIIASDLLISSTMPVSSWGEAIRQSAFQVISFSTSTGLATQDTTVWPALCVQVLLFLSLMGACSGSTTGGMKADRVWILYKSVQAQIKKQLHPNAVIQTRVGNEIIDNSVTLSVAIYISMYLTITFICALILAATGLDFMDSLTSSLASMGNIGPGFGSCGSLDNFGHFPSVSKFILTLEMLLGRVEIYPFLLITGILRKH